MITRCRLLVKEACSLFMATAVLTGGGYIPIPDPAVLPGGRDESRLYIFHPLSCSFCQADAMNRVPTSLTFSRPSIGKPLG